MPRKKELLIADWDEEERHLQQEYKQRLGELKASRRTSEVVGQVLTRGLLPLYILYLLSEKPHNGNELATAIGERTGGAWEPSTGGIYPHLRKFEKQGLVEGRWADPDKRTQRIYRLTPKGVTEFATLRQGLQSKMRRALGVFEIIMADLFPDEGRKT